MWPGRRNGTITVLCVLQLISSSLLIPNVAIRERQRRVTWRTTKHCTPWAKYHICNVWKHRKYGIFDFLSSKRHIFSISSVNVRSPGRTSTLIVIIRLAGIHTQAVYRERSWDRIILLHCKCKLSGGRQEQFKSSKLLSIDHIRCNESREKQIMHGEEGL